MKPRRFILSGVFVLAAAPCIHASDGTWTRLPSGGLWSNPANWLGGTVADGSGMHADFSMLDITGGHTVHLDSARTIGSMTIGDTVTASAAQWNLGNNGNPANVLTFAGAAPTITVNAMGVNGSATVSAILAGNNGLTKSGPQKLVLSGANTFTGTLTVNGPITAGIGSIPNVSGPLGNNPSVVMANVAGAEIRTIYSLNLGSLTGGGASGGRIYDSNNVTFTIGADNTSPSPFFGGIISLTVGGRLVKIGTGKLTLAGSNDYKGPTTISGGELAISSTGRIHSTSNVVLAGGSFDYSSSTPLNRAVTFSATGSTLRGTGTITQAVTVTSGNTLAPGSGGVGALNISAVTLDTGSTLKAEINTSGAPAADLLNVAGDMNLQPSALLDLSDIGSDVPLVLGTTLTLIDYAGTWNGGTFAGLPDDGIFGLGSNQFQISYNGPTGTDTAVTLTAVVPEPASATFLSLGMLLLLTSRGGRRAFRS